jgi:drug/metabolite transporter (DMT)-like permease
VTAIRAARRTDSARAIFGAFCVVGIFCSVPWALGDWRNPDPMGWTLLLAIGAVSVAAQMLMTHAVSSVHPATAGILSQVTVVFAMGLGWFFDHEPLTWLSGIGAVLTVGGAIFANSLTPSKR